MRRLTEGSAIFLSILKWFILSTVVGVIVGVSTAVFLKLLHWSIGIGGDGAYFFLLPIALFVSALLIKYLAPDAKGHGTEKVIEAVHKHDGKIKKSVVPIKLLATIVTIGAGGSAGKEGPAAQIGCGISSWLGSVFKLNAADRKKLVISGISAGFSAIFGTPIAGAIFGVEVLFVGSLLYDVLLPSFIAGMVSFQVATAMGIQYAYSPVNLIPAFSQTFLIKVLLAGIFFGLVSFLLIEFMQFTQWISHKIKIWSPWKALIGGVALVGLTLTFSKKYLGLGLETIANTLQGKSVEWYAFIVKGVFTSITLTFGGSGGLLTPVFFIGASAGSFFANLLGLDVASFAALGLVAVLAGSANTPIAASIMAVELFGPSIAPYAAIVCVVSFLITGHRSVYPSQILGMKKAESLDIIIGPDVEHTKISIIPGKGMTNRVLRFTEKIDSGEFFYDITKFVNKKVKIDKLLYNVDKLTEKKNKDK